MTDDAWTLEDWLDRLGEALDLDLVVPSDTLLDLTREVAHQVARPAAPLTLFLVGFAAASRGGGPDDVTAAAAVARDLAAGPA